MCVGEARHSCDLLGIVRQIEDTDHHENSPSLRRAIGGVRKVHRCMHSGLRADRWAPRHRGASTLGLSNGAHHLGRELHRDLHALGEPLLRRTLQEAGRSTDFDLGHHCSLHLLCGAVGSSTYLRQGRLGVQRLVDHAARTHTHKQRELYCQ